MVRRGLTNIFTSENRRILIGGSIVEWVCQFYGMQQSVVSPEVNQVCENNKWVGGGCQFNESMTFYWKIGLPKFTDNFKCTKLSTVDEDKSFTEFKGASLLKYLDEFTTSFF